MLQLTVWIFPAVFCIFWCRYLLDTWSINFYLIKEKMVQPFAWGVRARIKREKAEKIWVQEEQREGRVRHNISSNEADTTWIVASTRDPGQTQLPLSFSFNLFSTCVFSDYKSPLIEWGVSDVETATTPNLWQVYWSRLTRF